MVCIHTYLEKYYDLVGASVGKQRGRTEDSIWDRGGLGAASCWSAKLRWLKTGAFTCMGSLMQATLTHAWRGWCEMHAGQNWVSAGVGLKTIFSSSISFCNASLSVFSFPNLHMSNHKLHPQTWQRCDDVSHMQSGMPNIQGYVHHKALSLPHIRDKVPAVLLW